MEFTFSNPRVNFKIKTVSRFIYNSRVFQSLGNLLKLDLARNRIAQIDQLVFQNTVHLKSKFLSYIKVVNRWWNMSNDNYIKVVNRWWNMSYDSYIKVVNRWWNISYDRYIKVVNRWWNMSYDSYIKVVNRWWNLSNDIYVKVVNRWWNISYDSYIKVVNRWWNMSYDTSESYIPLYLWRVFYDYSLPLWIYT